MDLITLTQAKNYANKVAAGFSSVEVDGTNINFTLNDGSKATVIVPVPADGKDGAAGISVINLSIDTDGSLLCHMSDGSIIDAGHVPTIDPDLSKYYTKEEINSLFGKTFLWDGLSGEENTDNLSLFDEFYTNFVASEGKTKLLAKTPNAQNPIYMNADVQVDPTQGERIRLTVHTFPRGSRTVDYSNTDQYSLFSYYANIIIENEKCIEVSELELDEDKLNFLSTTENYNGYYTPAYEGSPVSKGYMVETLKEGKYSISPDQLEKEFQRVLTEPVITIDSTDSTKIEFVSYEAEENGKYGFTLNQKPWGDDYVSTNGAHDNSYALGKFILNNPGEKTIRVSINYSLECKSTDTAVFSKLDTTVAANSWNDSENAYKVITGETSTSGSVAYDLPSGQHFVTFKYMVGWKSTGEGENDALTVSFGNTQGAVQEHYLSTQQFVKDYVTGEMDSKLNTKVDKIEGKDLSSNDFTDNLKTKLEGLSNYNDTEIKTSLNSKANSADVYTKTEITTELNTKVDKVEGKGLSTNDFTDDLNTKLTGIATGAEVNTINTVKLNGEALTITDKSVNIEVPIPQEQNCDVPYDAGNLPISVINGANGFTQNQKSFSAIASSGTTYETTITVNKENISTIVLSASLAQHNSNNQTSTKFIETGCVAKIEFLYQGQSQTIKEVSTIGQSVLIEGAINGMQIKLTLQCSDNSKNVMFKVNIENYCINETVNNTLTISDSGDMYLQNILKQKTAELQTQIDWINNDTSKDMQVVPLYDTQASANLTMLNNTEYRTETHSGTSTLNIDFEEGFETVDTATYKSVLILRTGTNDNDSCTVTVPDGVILQGDDAINNTLTTQKLKVYEISFNWHGFMMIGLVKGFSYPAPLA